MVSYHPGSKNGKADTLSRQFEAPDESGQPDLILPATAMLVLVQWEIRRAHQLPATQAFRATAVPSTGNAVDARDTQLGTPRDPQIDAAHQPPVLVAFSGVRHGEVHSAVLHVRSGADQLPTPRGSVGAAPGSPTPLVAPIHGLPY
ncbi:hypothetical protein QTP70_009152 [Hemibagrus guttatus]|uniref:Uncharacterized protein n=1 Tax=Hemibagrus guttatus TaxID=175788 RepID=A0AAE0PYE8_9TELE|nr:hypothetical protein QTP70_009152 [Hemibagrus guttatus]KAK3529936.1 hypothetical protein QTP86_009321 [Hemibagrus guttatus]